VTRRNLLLLLGGRRGGFLVAGSRSSGGFVARGRFGGALRGSSTFGGAFFAFLLFLDHLDVAGSGGFGRSGLFFSARHSHGDNRDILVAEDFHTLGRFDFADM